MLGFLSLIHIFHESQYRGVRHPFASYNSSRKLLSKKQNPRHVWHGLLIKKCSDEQSSLRWHDPNQVHGSKLQSASSQPACANSPRFYIFKVYIKWWCLSNSLFYGTLKTMCEALCIVFLILCSSVAAEKLLAWSLRGDQAGDRLRRAFKSLAWMGSYIWKYRKERLISWLRKIWIICQTLIQSLAMRWRRNINASAEISSSLHRRTLGYES